MAWKTKMGIHDATAKYLKALFYIQEFISKILKIIIHNPTSDPVT